MANILIPKQEKRVTPVAILGAVLLGVGVVVVAGFQMYLTVKQAAAGGIAEDVNNLSEDVRAGFDLAESLEGAVLPETNRKGGQLELLGEFRDELNAIVDEMGERMKHNKYQQLPVAEEKQASQTYGEQE